MAAVLLFVVGDLVTTGVGLRFPTLTEAGPITGPALRGFGPLAVLALKSLTLAGCYLLWRLVPRPHRLGVPLGLLALGGWIVGWNLSMVLLVG